MRTIAREKMRSIGNKWDLFINITCLFLHKNSISKSWRSYGEGRKFIYLRIHYSTIGKASVTHRQFVGSIPLICFLFRVVEQK